MTIFFIVTALLIVLILIGMPIAFSIGITSITYILLTNPANISIVPLRMFAGVNSFILMAIPFFVLAAEIMVKAGISTRLFQFVKLFVKRFRGGLALVNVLGSTIFGSISGAALSDVAGLGKVEIEAMKEDGYDPDFACALTAASSIQSPLIPPSNTAVLYAGIMGMSVGSIFMASVVPGVLIALSQIIYICMIAKKRNFPRDLSRTPFSAILLTLKDGLIALVMPAIILVGIMGGIFTPTEAACVAVLYSLITGLVLYANISWRDIVDSIWSSVKTSGSLFIIIAFASVFSWTMSIENIPNEIGEFLLSITSSPQLLMFIVNILLIIVGMWMETGAAVILFAPILSPIMSHVGIHPIHFAVVMLVNLTIGLLTPPVGVVLYATASVGKISFERMVRASVPFIILSFIVLALLSYFPEISLFIPRAMGLIN